MKKKKNLSSVLLGIGCVFYFLGIFALLLPMSRNTHVQMIIAGFSAPSEKSIVRLLNAILSWSLENSLLLIAAGLVILLAGLLLVIRPEEPEEEEIQPLLVLPAPDHCQSEETQEADSGIDWFVSPELPSDELKFEPILKHGEYTSPAEDLFPVRFPEEEEDFSFEPAADNSPAVTEYTVSEGAPKAPVLTTVSAEEVHGEAPPPIPAEEIPQRSYLPNEETFSVMLSPRIRSTVGRRKESPR